MKLLPGEIHDAVHGPLDCPYCGKRVADSVAQYGQQVNCPHCHSAFQVPETRVSVLNEQKRIQTNIANQQAIWALISMAFFALAAYWWFRSALGI